MASIKETMEAVFAAAAFAERGCQREAFECLASVAPEPGRPDAESQARKDPRPRLRV